MDRAIEEALSLLRRREAARVLGGGGGGLLLLLLLLLVSCTLAVACGMMDGTG